MRSYAAFVERKQAQYGERFSDSGLVPKFRQYYESGQRVRVEAATRRTFARAYVNKDGSGYVEVVRDGERLHRFDFEAETIR